MLDLLKKIRSALPSFDTKRPGWADRGMVAKAVHSACLNYDAGVPLGIMPGKPDHLCADITNLSYANLVGPPGSGKTSRFVIPWLLSLEDRNVLVHDPKRDILAKARAASAKFDAAIVLDWDDPAKSQDCWNPLGPEWLPTSEPARSLYLDCFLETLYQDLHPDPFWTKMARRMAKPLIEFLAMGRYLRAHQDRAVMEILNTDSPTGREYAELTQDIGPELSPFSLSLFLDKGTAGSHEATSIWLRRIAACQRSIIDATIKAIPFAPLDAELDRLAGTPSRTLSAILATIDAGLIIFKAPNVRVIMERTSFTPEDCFQNPPKHPGIFLTSGVASGSGPRLLNTLFLRLYRRTELIILSYDRKDRPAPRTAVLLDEAAYLDPITVKDMCDPTPLNPTLYVWQSTETIERLLGRKGADAFLDRADMTICLASRSGETPRRLSEMSAQDNAGARTLTPEAIADLAVDQAVVLSKVLDNRPLLLRTIPPADVSSTGQ